MKKKKVTLSICIPTFNRAELLEHTLYCAAHQTVKPYEVIIVDNASTDNTREVVKKYKRYGFKYVRNKRNIGLMQNINRCIKLATGSHLIFLHSDDLVSPDWYESFHQVISHHEAMLYTTPILIIDENEKLKYVCHMFDKSQLLKQPVVIKKLWSKLTTGPGPSAATAYDMRVFKNLGVFNLEYKTEADIMMTYQTISMYDIYFLRQWVYAHRSHPMQGFDLTRQKKNLVEELKRVDNYFSILKSFYTTNKSSMTTGRYFIQIPLFMTLTPINLYIIKFQISKIAGYYKIAFKYFPDLFRYPSDWIIFLRVQLFFVGRALFGKLLAQRDKHLASWYEVTVNELRKIT